MGEGLGVHSLSPIENMPVTDDYICNGCHQSMTMAKREGFLCHCGGTFKYIHAVFAILGLDYDIGYRPGVDDREKEVRYDMKKLEEKAMETGNLKKHGELKRALANFEESNSDVLSK